MIVPLGIGTFLWDMTGPQREDALTKTAAMLAKGSNDFLVREVLRWSDVQTTEGGSFNWSIADAVATAAADHGARVWWILSHPPNWATAPGSATPHAAWPCPPYVDVHTASGGLAIDYYQAFCRAAAARYGPGGTFWVTYDGTALPTTHFEIWNEEYTTLAASRWNGSAVVAGPSQPGDYAAMYHKAAIAVHTVHGVKAVAGVCERTWNSDPVGAEYLVPFLTTLGYMPAAVSIHPYILNHELPSYEPVDPQHRWAYYTQTANVRALVGPDPEVWITELGVSTVGTGVTEAEQAAWYVDLWAKVKADEDIDGLIVFASHHPDYPDNPALPGYTDDNPENGLALWHTGATNHDLAGPKPAVAVITAMPAITFVDPEERRYVTTPPDSGKLPAEVIAGLDRRFAHSDHTHDIDNVYGLNFALGDKVDKTAQPRKAYGTNDEGAQALYEVSATEDADTVAYRGAGGTLAVGDPTAAEHATTRQWADDHKVERTTTPTHLYGTNDAAEETTYGVAEAATPDTVAYRSAAGTLAVADPTADNHAATRLYVATKIAELLDSAPGTLDTLNELAAALGDDPNYAATTAAQIGLRALASRLISSGTGLSGGGDLSADRTLSVLYGAAAGTAVQGNDSRLTRRSLRSYMKPAAAHPFPAAEISSLTLTTSAPAFTGMRYYPWNHADFATKYVKVAGKLVDNGGVGFNIINGASSSMSITGCSLESYISGDRFSFQLQSYGDHDYNLFIDDMPVNLAPTHFSASANVYFLTVVFTSQRTRKVRLQLGQAGVLQLFTSNNGFIWAAEPRHKVAVIGDSFTHGNGGSTEGSITSGTIGGGLERFAGFDVYNMGQGGTGYSNPGNGTNTAPGPNNVDRFGAASRLAALALLPAMDLIMVVGGANDGDIATYPVATTVSRAQTLWSAIQTARPTTPLIVAGIESGVYPAINADLDTLNNALKAAALAHTGVTAYIDMRNPMWVYGTGKLNAQVGDGNADIFVSSDGVHPSHAGWDYESQRLTTEIAKVLVP